MRNRQISAISWGQKLHRISNGWRCTLCPRAFFGANLSRVHFRWTSAEALSLEGFRFHIDFTKMVGTGISKWNTERLFSVHVTSLRRRNWTAQADLPIPNTTVDGWYPMPVDSYLIVYGLFCVYMYMHTYIYAKWYRNSTTSTIFCNTNFLEIQMVLHNFNGNKDTPTAPNSSFQWQTCTVTIYKGWHDSTTSIEYCTSLSPCRSAAYNKGLAQNSGVISRVHRFGEVMFGTSNQWPVVMWGPLNKTCHLGGGLPWAIPTSNWSLFMVLSLDQAPRCPSWEKSKIPLLQYWLESNRNWSGWMMEMSVTNLK